MENIAKGKVKLVRYTEDGAYLQPTINEGERIPTEELCVKEVDENGHEWDLYVIDDRDDDYEEKRDLFLENDGTYGVVALLNKYGVTTDSYEPETDEYYCEVDASPYQVVYDTSKSPEENQKLVRDYFEELFWNYPQYSPLELIYQIANFFKYHVIDVVECFGGMDGVNKFWKELVEAYSLDPAHKEDFREEIRLIEGELPEHSSEEAEQVAKEELAQISVDEYVQDIEQTIDTFCKEAEEILKRLEITASPLEEEKERIELAKRARQLNTGNIVSRLYRKVVEIGEYDVKEGNKPINKACAEGVTMGNMPAEMAHYYEHESKKGCCFVFSTVVMKYLHDLGIKTWLITTPEGNGQRASFMYVDDNGEPVVANPVADVEYFKEHGINTPEERAKFYETDRFSARFRVRGDRHDYSRIPLYKFEEMYGPISMYGDFYSEKLSGKKFTEVSAHPMDVKEVYEHLGKKLEYEWYEEKSRTGKERTERRAKLRQENGENPENPDNQEL